MLEGDYYMSDVLVELKGRVAIATLINEATYNALGVYRAMSSCVAGIDAF